jgi:hypothetical protein
MVKWRLTFVLCLCSLGSALAQLSPLEQRVIGVWQFSGRDPGRITLRADHTCATILPIAGGSGWEILAKGTWTITLFGQDSEITDSFGQDGLRNFAHNLAGALTAA